MRGFDLANLDIVDTGSDLVNSLTRQGARLGLTGLYGVVK